MAAGLSEGRSDLSDVGEFWNDYSGGYRRVVSFSAFDLSGISLTGSRCWCGWLTGSG